MAMQRTLLERIRDPDPPGRREVRVSTRAVFESILRNLADLLNTTQGNCLTDPNYGLPHLTVVRGQIPISLAGYEAAIRRTIEKHEPRLTGVRVRHTPTRTGSFELRFEISGLVVDDDGRTTVRFETYADDDGKIFVK